VKSVESLRCTFVRIVSIGMLLCCAGAFSADAENVKPEDYLPENSLVAITAPDLSALRAALNKTQLADMFSQPEMQDFLAPALTQLRATYNQLRAKKPLLPALEDLDKGLLSGEITLAVFGRDAADGGPPVGGVVSLCPSQPDAITKLLTPIFPGQLPPDGAPFPLGNPDDPTAPSMALLGGRLLLAVPGSTMPAFLERLKNPPGAKAPGTLAAKESFAAAHAKLKNSGAYIYVDPAGIFNVITQAQPNDKDMKKAALVVNALGLQSLAAVLISAGVAGDEIVVEASLQADAAKKPAGIFALFMAPGEPISKTALHIAAADAPFVNAGHFEWSEGFQKLQQALGATGMAIPINVGLTMANMRVGFNIQQDFLANLGSETVIARTALETAPPLSFAHGIVGSIALHNPAKVADCLEKLHRTFGQDKSDPVSMMFQFRKLENGEKSIYYFKQLVTGSWAVAVVDDRLVFGSTINAVRRGMEQLAAKTDILSNADFQATVARITGQPFDADKLPSGLSYQMDESSGGGPLLLASAGLLTGSATLAGIAEAVNPTPVDNVPGGDRGGMAEVQQFFERPSGKTLLELGNSIDLGLWPDEGFFLKYRRARGSYWAGDPLGLYVRSELPIPNSGYSSAGGPLVAIGAAGIVAGIVMPVLARARATARRVSNENRGAPKEKDKKDDF